MKWRPITAFFFCLIAFLSLGLYFLQRERQFRAASSPDGGRPSRIVQPPALPVDDPSKPWTKGSAKSDTNTPATKTPTTPAAAKPADTAAVSTPQASSGATITGKVLFRGTAATEKAIDMAADTACKNLHNTPVTTRHYVVGKNGELANVFVCIKSGLTPTPQAAMKKAVLDQQGCLYSPFVMGVLVNQELEIWNSDPTLHNVHYFPNNNPEGNKGMPVEGMKFSVKYPKPELDAPVRFRCDVHPWMFAYVFVVPHPFFDVTRDEGTFSLKGLPAGTYSIETWHPKAGSLTNTVTVGANESKEITFEYK